MPRVLIGIPARNEARFIAQTLDSVLAQELADWELVVSDNASTDGTADIVRSYAAADARIRLDTPAVPVTQNENYNRLARSATSPYFVWLGAHDRWHPSFLSECVAALDADQRHVLAFSDVVLIDSNAEPIPFGYSPASLSRTTSSLLSLDTRLCRTAEARFITFLFGGMNGVHVHGVMRTGALRKTCLLRPGMLPDISLVAELSLLGSFARVEGPPLFELRMVREKSWAERALALSPGEVSPWARVLPWHHLATECITAPLRIDTPLHSRALAMTAALACACTTMSVQLRMELFDAARYGFTTKHHEPDRHETVLQSVQRTLRLLRGPERGSRTAQTAERPQEIPCPAYP